MIKALQCLFVFSLEIADLPLAIFFEYRKTPNLKKLGADFDVVNKFCSLFIQLQVFLYSIFLIVYLYILG